MAVLLLSAHPLLKDIGVLHLYPSHMTGLPTYLPPPQLVIVLTLDQTVSTGITNQRGDEGHPPLLVSLVTNEPT